MDLVIDLDDESIMFVLLLLFMLFVEESVMIVDMLDFDMLNDKV